MSLVSGVNYELKATKTFTEFITNCANKNLKLKRRYKTNKKM